LCFVAKTGTWEPVGGGGVQGFTLFSVCGVGAVFLPPPLFGKKLRKTEILEWKQIIGQLTIDIRIFFNTRVFVFL
jgi:hypothetical protein